MGKYGMGPMCDRKTVEALHKMGKRIASRWDGCMGLTVVADPLPLGVTVWQYDRDGSPVMSWTYFRGRNGKFRETSADHTENRMEREYFESIDAILAAW